MSGFTSHLGHEKSYHFTLDTPDLADGIRRINKEQTAIMLLLDGEELDAALWGLENYRERVAEVEQSNRLHPSIFVYGQNGDEW